MPIKNDQKNASNLVTFKHITFFADILRQFNPEVRGFSTGSGDANSAGARYNVAVAGAIAQ